MRTLTISTLWLVALCSSVVAQDSSGYPEPSPPYTAPAVIQSDLGECIDLLPAREPVQVTVKPIIIVCETVNGIPAYVTGYSHDDWRPIWAAYVLTREQAQAGKASAISRKIDGVRFVRSNKIPAVDQPTSEDYAKNGFQMERGHLAPANAFKWSIDAYHSTFKMTNIVPQYGPLNEHLWACLEESIIDWADQFGKLYVIVGGTSDSGERAIGNGSRKITVPKYMFAVIVRPDGHILSILIPNDSSFHSGLAQYVSWSYLVESAARVKLSLPFQAHKERIEDWPNKCG